MKQTVHFERVEINPEQLTGLVEQLVNPAQPSKESEWLKRACVQQWVPEDSTVDARLVTLEAGSTMRLGKPLQPGIIAVWAQLDGQTGLRGGGVRERMNTRLVARPGESILKIGRGRLSLESETKHPSTGVLFEVSPK